MGTSYSDLFAANLRAARARSGISQTMLANRMKRLGFGSWSGGKVSECENGQRAVVAGELLALAVALETTLNDIVGGNVPPDIVVEMPEAVFSVAGVNVRNSAYGYRDSSVSWHGDELSIIRPANAYSAMAEDKSRLLAGVHPSRLARTA